MTDTELRAEARDRLIVALDVPTLDEAIPLVRQLKSVVTYFKVGLQLANHTGLPTLLRELPAYGVEHLMLDLKLADIGNTVGRAIEAIGSLQGAHIIDYLTIFGSISPAALATAATTCQSLSKPITPIAITLLTDFGNDGNDCFDLYQMSPHTAMRRIASRAHVAGIRTVVCAATDLPALFTDDPRQRSFEAYTPAIRPANSCTNDQQRIATPAVAIANGARRLIVGRPIIEAADPLAAARAILIEIAAALTQRRVLAS